MSEALALELAPAGVADAIMAVTAMDQPPLRLAVGADAIDGIRASLQSRLAELDRWDPALAASGSGSGAGSGSRSGHG